MPASSPSHSVEQLWDVIVADAQSESPLWLAAAVPAARRSAQLVFSPLAEERFAVGIETIYEGYLLHYGGGRLFRPSDADVALLLGDYLYARGLVRIAALDDIEAVADLAALISLCAQLRADDRPGDGIAWAATAALLGSGGLADAREALATSADAGPLADIAARAAGPEALERALAVHGQYVR